MSTIIFYNNNRTTLAGSITSGATTLQVAAGSSASYSPAPSGGNYFIATLTDAATESNIEIIHVTAVNTGTDVLTIVRGQEGTTAQNWNANDIVSVRPTAGGAGFLLQEDGSNYGFGLSEQASWLSGSGHVSNQTAGPLGFLTLLSVGFTFPGISPTGRFALGIQTVLTGGMLGSQSGPALGGWQQGQIVTRVRDITGSPILLMRTAAQQYMASDVGGGFDWTNFAIAGNNSGGTGFSTLLYYPGDVITVEMGAALANFGSYPIGAGVDLTGILILTAFPA